MGKDCVAVGRGLRTSAVKNTIGATEPREMGINSLPIAAFALLLFLTALPGAFAISLPGLCFAASILILSLFLRRLVRESALETVADWGIYVLSAGLAAFGFLLRSNTWNAVMCAGFLVLTPLVFIGILQRRTGRPSWKGPAVLVFTAVASILLGKISIPWPTSAAEMQRFFGATIPLGCVFLVPSVLMDREDGKRVYAGVSLCTCSALIVLAGISLWREHKDLVGFVNEARYEGSFDELDVKYRRIPLSASDSAKYYAVRGTVEYRQGDLSAALKEMDDFQKVCKQRKLSSSMDFQDLKRRNFSLWPAAFGTNETATLFGSRQYAGIAYSPRDRSFVVADREGNIMPFDGDEAIPARLGLSIEGSVEGFAREGDRYALLYAGGALEIWDGTTTKVLRRSTDAGSDRWKDVAAAPGNKWAAIAEDGEIRLIDPEKDESTVLAERNLFWEGQNVAQSLVVTGERLSGYYVDHYGGVHPYGDPPMSADDIKAATGTDGNYITESDFMVGIVAGDRGKRVITVDRYGGVHRLTKGDDGCVWSDKVGDRATGWNPVTDVVYIEEVGRLYLLRERGDVEVIVDVGN